MNNNYDFWRAIQRLWEWGSLYLFHQPNHKIHINQMGVHAADSVWFLQSIKSKASADLQWNLKKHQLRECHRPILYQNLCPWRKKIEYLTSIANFECQNYQQNQNLYWLKYECHILKWNNITWLMSNLVHSSLFTIKCTCYWQRRKLNLPAIVNLLWQRTIIFNWFLNACSLLLDLWKIISPIKVQNKRSQITERHTSKFLCNWQLPTEEYFRC